MRLSRLIQGVEHKRLVQSGDPEILSLCEDSRKAEKGSLFFARKGSKTSGLKYIGEALASGAAGIVSEEELTRDALAVPVPLLRVKSILEAQWKLSETFYGSPSKQLTIVGVTGTNGKTTFTYLLEAMAREMGWRSGVIGTVNYRVPRPDSFDQEILPAPNTTPNPLELQGLLAAMRDRGADLVVMEVSSHALELGRVEGIEFDGAVFTNLTQDHLDFHGTMENYFSAKSLLFRKMLSLPKDLSGAGGGRKAVASKFCIINLDDPYGKRMIPFCAAPCVTYGLSETSDFMAEEVELSSRGSSFMLARIGERMPVKIGLCGRYNVYNALSAIASGVSLGISMPAILKGLEKVTLVPGRLETVDCGQDFSVFIDYAHTEDALRNVLTSIRQFAKNRVLTLFGCGGDRDRSKRPKMGEAAAELSDWIVVTSDNPRSEDPQDIALDIEVGIRRAGSRNYEVVIDREQAIARILSMAKKGDVVLIAGKGHETYQIFSDHSIHFDDRETVKKHLCHS